MHYRVTFSAGYAQGRGFVTRDIKADRAYVTHGGVLEFCDSGGALIVSYAPTVWRTVVDVARYERAMAGKPDEDPERGETPRETASA